MMSDSTEKILTFSVLTCQADQFTYDSAEILIFTLSNALQRIIQISDVFRQVCSAEQGQIYSLGMFLICYVNESYTMSSKMKSRLESF